MFKFFTGEQLGGLTMKFNVLPFRCSDNKAGILMPSDSRVLSLLRHFNVILISRLNQERNVPGGLFEVFDHFKWRARNYFGAEEVTTQ